MVSLRIIEGILAALCTVALMGAEAPAGQCRREVAENNEAKTKMPVVVYSVADLVIPIDAPADEKKTLEDTLIRAICNVIAPESWADVGGAATIQYFPTGMALVVKQTQANHEQIANLLADLRRLQDVEVAVEVRLIALPQQIVEHFMTLAGFQKMHCQDPRRSVEAASFNDRQVRSWMHLVQCRQAWIMQAPKLTLFNGQHANLNIEDSAAITRIRWVDEVCVPEREVVETGLRVNVLPVVSADRRYVRLHVDMNFAHVDGEDTLDPTVHRLALDKVLVIPDGGTLACRLGKLGEGREVFVLVTPRLIVNEEAVDPR